MKSRGWATRTRHPRLRSKFALIMITLQVMAVTAAGVVAQPGTAWADQPGTERSGQVSSNPNYTWDVIIDTAGNQIVTILGPGTNGIPQAWASFNGSPWYVTNQYSSAGVWVVVNDPTTLPQFMNPDDPNYPMFIYQLLPPAPLPDIFPPPSAPPTLDQGDPGDDPGYYSGTDNGGSDDLGDLYWGSGSGDGSNCLPEMDCDVLT